MGSEYDMDNDKDEKQLTQRPDEAHLAERPGSIRLGESEELDVSQLTDEQAKELRVRHGEMMLDRDDRRAKLKEDLTVSAEKLNTYTSAVIDTAAEKASITITNTNDDSLGRTEIIVGNTEAARRGKLSRSQIGWSEKNWFWIVVVAIIAFVIILIAALN